MNLADYLSELLGQHDEVSVPGLGCFIRERIEGYYNDRDAKFYPPKHKVKFVPVPKQNDDVFTQYVAEKKNISLASSKYFAEKFVSKLNEDAGRGKYVFSDLGTFTKDMDRLVFKPHDKITEDPAFYGYTPVNILKAAESVAHPNPVIPQYAPTASAPILTHKPIQPPPPGLRPQLEEEYIEEEPVRRKKGVSIPAVVVITLIVIILALLATYKFLPAQFSKISAAYYGIVGKKDTTTVSVMRHQPVDTTEKETAVRDTAKLKTTKAVADDIADTIRHSRFEVIEGKYAKIAKAQAAVNYLKAQGFAEAKILVDATGPLLKVSVESFKSYEEAAAARTTLISAGKIKDKSSSILPIQ